jgi:hypothetical protein
VISSSLVNADLLLDHQEEIDHILNKPQLPSGILTHKKFHQLLKEEYKEGDKEKQKQPKRVGRKLAKGKREEETNKEKILGIQTTIEKSLGDGTRSVKNPGVIAPSQDGSHKTIYTKP